MLKPLACIPLVVLVLLAPAARAGRPDVAAATRQSEYEKRIGYTGNAFNNVFRAAARVDIRKPIGEYEAYVLASAYFFSRIGLCGSVHLPKRRGDVWIAETLEGYPSGPGPRIIIQSKGGVTYAARYPRVTNPKNYLKSLQNI
jgi:hypothetical protein